MISRPCRRSRAASPTSRASRRSTAGRARSPAQDNRANNVTVDGSYFNNSFGLGVTTGGIGDRTGVAPISLEAVEQIQVQVAPYDVRQGNFTGAGVNTVTRSGTNSITASYYHRQRNQSYVGTDAAGQVVNPGTFDTTVNGTWAGGPIIKNKWFAFGAYEKQSDSRPLTTFMSNPGGAPVTGNTTRVLTSDMQGLSDYLQKNFNYATGPFDNIPKLTPAKPWMIKSDYNVNSQNKVTFRYNQLDSSTDALQSGGTSLGNYSRATNSTQFLSFANSNYQILENLKSGVGEWNSVFGSSLTNNLLIGYTHQDESRGDKGQNPAFPFVVIGDGAGTALATFGNEPFTPFNLLRYNTFQVQDSVTKFAKNHSITFGGNLEKFHSDNSFYFGVQSAYTYASLADFYTDANGYLANPNRTVSPVNLVGFQVKYLLQPGQTTPPLQPLDVIYAGGYVQDEWRPRSNLTVTYGLRVDVPRFGATGFDNPVADQLTFRDQDGSPVKYNTGQLPSVTPYWSPRVGFNYDLNSDQATQLRGGTGLFSGKPPYVWISNQIGNTGVLAGFIDTRPQTSTTVYPFNPSTDKYKPAPTGGTAASYELDLTDNGYRFPQTWRTNIGVDRKLPGGLVGTLDYLYSRDINAPMYINANLPASNTRIHRRGQPSAVGCDSRRCSRLRHHHRLGEWSVRQQDQQRQGQSGHRELRAQGPESEPGLEHFGCADQEHDARLLGQRRLQLRPLVEPHRALIDGGDDLSEATESSTDPNNPALAYSQNSPGKRYFAAVNYTASYFNWGATTFSVLLRRPHERKHQLHVRQRRERRWLSNQRPDLHPERHVRDELQGPETSRSQGGTLFTPAQQAAAFEQLIESDPYLSSHRGQYAQRNAVFLPVVNRIDFSVMQDVHFTIGGRKNTGQIRLDIANFGNLLNHDWGVGTRLTNNLILTSPGADAQGRLTYNLQTLNGQLITNARQLSANLLSGTQLVSDVYVLMLSFRYTFQ